MRLAANAPRFAARFLFTNPAIAIGSAVLAAWLATEGLRWNSDENRWEKDVPGPVVNQTQYIVNNARAQWNATKEGTCTQLGVIENALTGQANTYFVATNGLANPNGTNCSVRTPQGQVFSGSPFSTRVVQVPGEPMRIPVGDIEFEDKMAPTALPEGAPNALPTPLPVQAPKLNPVPSPDGQPSPLRIPTGDPYPVPNSNPQRYERPVTDIVPSPTPTEPWRMDIQPRVIETPSLDPNVVPNPNPQTDPAPNPDPQTEEQPDLCEKNPDILACAKPELDTPEVETPKRSFMLTYAAENLFGTGSCPANKTMALRGQQITVWDMQRTCELIGSYLKPIVILLATFAAFTILSPGKME